MKPIDLNQFEGMTAGPWAWQLFGDTYSLTAQHGRREQIINAIKHGEIGYPVVAMNKDGRLRDVDPEWPNARAIAAVPDLIDEVKQLRAWREEALQVLSQIDFQLIGKELGLGLGQDVAPQILPGIKRLNERIKAHS